MGRRDEAYNFARRLHALCGGGELVRKAAARELARMDPFDATELLHELLRLARAGDEPSGCALVAVVAALGLEAAQLPNAAALRRLARVQSLDSVAALFTAEPARREYHPGAAAKRDAQAFSDSLGHLKQKARLTRDPDVLSRLVTVSDPSVIRNALINPRLTEPLVVRMAARRPARPEPLVEIWRSPRWSACHAVRRALAFNPYLPTGVAAKIVPLLTTTDLSELAGDTAVHPCLREQAGLLLQVAREEQGRR